MKQIDYTEVTIKLMDEYTSKYLQENAELVQDTIKATLEAINYSQCCKSDSEQLFDFLEWFDKYCTVDVKPNKEDVELYLSK